MDPCLGGTEDEGARGVVGKVGAYAGESMDKGDVVGGEGRGRPGALLRAVPRGHRPVGAPVGQGYRGASS